jgi:hypothetical protein
MEIAVVSSASAMLADAVTASDADSEALSFDSAHAAEAATEAAPPTASTSSASVQASVPVTDVGLAVDSGNHTPSGDSPSGESPSAI